VGRIRDALGTGSFPAAGSGVDISALNGVVTLRGTIPTYNDRDRIINLVRNTTGVNRVVDELQVPLTTAGMSTRDTELVGRIRDALSTGSLSATGPGIDISSLNGVVTLRGAVPSYDVRDRIDNLVRNTTGVTKVIDELQIGTAASTVPEWQQHDRALEAQLRQIITNNEILNRSAPNIFVNANNGTVTLTGAVQTEEQKRLLNTLAINTQGVDRVIDQLQVAAAPARTANQAVYGAPGTSQSSIVGSGEAGQIFSLHVQSLNDTDRGLAQGILQGLRTDRILSTMLPRVDINVADGRVVLQGEVQSDEQRRTIESAVRRAAGASVVEDQLQVRPTITSR
jgi:osmotically-inducible protein OsmY